MPPGVPAALSLRMERATSHSLTAWCWPALAPHSAGLSSQAAGPGANADNSRRSLQPSPGSLWLHQPTLPPATGQSGSTFLPSSQGRCQLAVGSALVSSSCSYHALGLLVFLGSYLLHLSRSHCHSASTAHFPGLSQLDAFPPEEE